MPKEKFVRRHLTDEEKHKFLRMDRELTDDEKERVKRYKKMIAEIHGMSMEEVLARGGQVTNGKDYENIDRAPETREDIDPGQHEDDGR